MSSIFWRQPKVDIIWREGTVMYSLLSRPKEEGYVSDSFGAFLVEGARFSSREEYPIIEESMIAQELPVDIMPINKAPSRLMKPLKESEEILKSI